MLLTRRCCIHQGWNHDDANPSSAAFINQYEYIVKSSHTDEIYVSVCIAQHRDAESNLIIISARGRGVEKQEALRSRRFSRQQALSDLKNT